MNNTLIEIFTLLDEFKLNPLSEVSQVVAILLNKFAQVLIPSN